MGDVFFIAVTIAFFALAAGFVRLCDRVIGPDDDTLPGATETEDASTTAPMASVNGEQAPPVDAGQVDAR